MKIQFELPSEINDLIEDYQAKYKICTGKFISKYKVLLALATEDNFKDLTKALEDDLKSKLETVTS